MPSAIKPTHKPIRDYFAKIAEYRNGNVGHEGATSTAFLNLLDDTRPRHWRLVPQDPFRLSTTKFVRPDGTLWDDFSHRRGYWEAKDTGDDLDTEIVKKRNAGYPFTNIIFEDTRTAVLFQNGTLAVRVDLADPNALVRLLNAFFDYAEPHIEDFHRAVIEFSANVPDLGKGLAERIAGAHADNPAFRAAFDGFFALCKRSLNPNIAVAAVDEMLVQHLLTERLIRTVFDNPDFVRKNVIAAEIEKVIDELTRYSFSRTEFLRSLDRFYGAIEADAKGITDFAEKQHFLNTVYERFFQGYSVKFADTHGIVYTPQPIVDFMCASVVDMLHDEFGKTLGDEDVQVIDPCTGTGNFIVNLLRRCPKEKLEYFYGRRLSDGAMKGGRLFANEIMLLPYYISALNIEHAYQDLAGEHLPFEGLCFVDTLDLVTYQRSLYVNDDNTKRVEEQIGASINVVIGNPPYSAHQVNENDNNKNRKYKEIDGKIAESYAADSQASNKNALYDPYVKFFKWATNRLGDRDGIVCFVSNNSFVDQIAFDGMRKCFERDFSRIWHVDLHGNVRMNPQLSGTTHNVFGIQVGVGITLGLKRKKNGTAVISYHRVPEDWRKEKKYEWLENRRALGGVKWETLTPDSRHTWLVPENADEFASYMPIEPSGAKQTSTRSIRGIFELFSNGVKTNRDDVVYDFNSTSLVERVRQFVEDYNGEIDRYRRAGGATAVSSLDEFVKYDRINWSRDLKADLQRGRCAEFRNSSVRHSLYRPFCHRFLFFDRILNEEVYGLPLFFPSPATEAGNRVIVASDIAYRAPTNSVLVTDRVPDLHLCASVDGHQCFPFYVYDEDGSNRRENITDWALGKFRERYGDASIGKWDIFHYVYAVLHHPGYRQKFADNLKRELPRIPFAPDFREYARIGKELAELHVGYEEVAPYEFRQVYDNAEWPKHRWRVEKMRLSKDKQSLVVNPGLTLHGIPEDAYKYRLGNRSALEWVVDQYQVKTDARSGIVSDPNRADDPEYIVNLVGRVVRVSIETVARVDRLAAMPYTEE